ncbi:MAG: hypothetical protein H6983_16215 [Ectothiorhodospiraceae bacterium]|nr:hypothetical protein [Chromatiales bacterium]MCP5155714.1 hypothetical protein [Ectothiorhodospiraceae bacterium]
MSGAWRPVGVVCALQAEAATLAALDRGRLRIAVCGVGAEAAERSARRLVDDGVRALVSWGVAVGLDPALAPGAVLVPARVLSGTGEVASSLEVDAATAAWSARVLGEAGAVVGGRLVALDAVVRTAADKRRLGLHHAASAGDMETGAVAGLARAAGLPWLVVRAVADPLWLSLPASVASAVDARGGIRVGPVLRELARRPTVAADLVRLGVAFRAALAGLRRTARAAHEAGGLLAPAARD